MKELKKVEINNDYIEMVRELVETLDSWINKGVDINKKVFISINNVGIREDYFDVGICGRGYTFAEACKDYWENLIQVIERKDNSYIEFNGKYNSNYHIKNINKKYLYEK